LFVAMFSFPRIVLSLKQSTEPTQVQYDLHKPLPDHSSLTRIRDRYGPLNFAATSRRSSSVASKLDSCGARRFNFDATKVEVNASVESIKPRFSVEQLLQDLFEEDEVSQGPAHDAPGAARAADRDLDHLPHSPKTENNTVPKEDACLLKPHSILTELV
jgi:hypothetical protein